jgi:hypothetical protein
MLDTGAVDRGGLVTVHTCHACGWESRPPAGVEVVFHPCRASGRRERLAFDLPDREEETQEWARSVLGAELAAAVERRDPDALLREVEG